MLLFRVVVVRSGRLTDSANGVHYTDPEDEGTFHFGHLLLLARSEKETLSKDYAR